MTTRSFSAEGKVDSSVARIESQDDVDLAWYNATELGVEGKAWHDTESFYDRLPTKAKNQVRPPVWRLSKHSSGICVRFATDATTIQARWTLISERLAMPHMPATSVSGVDLYVRTATGWRWLAVGQPTQIRNTAKLVHTITAKKRDYLLYLPLYNGVSSVEIGISTNASVWRQTLAENLQKPIVFWGTSITQGGCASRPGMVHTAILGRRFGRPVVNLGFSGNGRMEPEVAQLIAEIEAAVYVIDCLPNLDSAAVSERTEPLVRILRAAHPETPILLVEDRSYTNAFLIETKRQRNESSRLALREAFERLRSAGVQGLHYLTGDKLLGEDGEDTVDGSHPTDLGFLRQANAFESALRPLLD